MPELKPEWIEAATRALCKSKRFECGQGCCAPICMEALGDARRDCGHVKDVHGDLARAVLSAVLPMVEADMRERECDPDHGPDILVNAPQ